MTKTKEFLQKYYQSGDMICVTLINGREYCGTVEEFLEQSLILRRTGGAVLPIDYSVIGTFEKSAERQMSFRIAACAERRQAVTLTTKNGERFCGVPVDYDENVICIRAENGTDTMIALDYIGTLSTGVAVAEPSEKPSAVLQDSATIFAAPAPLQMTTDQRLKELVEPLEQKKRSLGELQTKLREDGTLASECNAKLNSLQNAIKINEYEAKYQRTPRILAELIQVMHTYYANPALLSVVGEVALMAGGDDEINNALKAYDRYWDRFCANDENLLRLLALLCEKQGSAAVLTGLVQKWSQGAEEAFLRAMAHYVLAMGVAVPDDVLSDSDSGVCCRRLWEVLTNQPFSAASVHSAQRDEQTAGSTASADAVAESSTVSAALPPLEPGERCGKITLYIPANGFGVITDTEGHTYSFVTHGMSAEEAEQIHYGAVVYFYKGLEPRYNKKKQQYVDIAEMIRVMADAEENDLPKPSSVPEFPVKRYSAEEMTDKEIGYVMLYRPFHRSGYICHEMNYGTAERGDIFFELTDMKNEMQLDTFHYHYKVAFNYVNGLQRRATNVIVLEKLPKPDTDKKSPAVLPLAHEDYDKLQFCVGETMLVERNGAEAVLGQFLAYTDGMLTLDVNSVPQSISTEQIAELFFAGVVTNYQVAALSGKINGQYPFRIHNVVGQAPDSILKQGLAPSMPCLYSLRLQNGELRVRTLRAFDETLCEKLPWQEGKVAGAYRSGYYFTANDTVRCHISTFADNITKDWMKQQDFQRQAVYYRCVSHKTGDSYRRDTLSYSAVQVTAKYQSAEVVSPLGVDGLRLQCGTRYFESPVDLSVYPLGKSLRAVLGLNENGALTVSEIDAEQLALPSYAAAILAEKQALEQSLVQAEEAGDMAQVAALNASMLQQAMIMPDKAMSAIFGACLRRNDMSVMKQVMDTHGHLLAQVVRLGYMMQLQCLDGDTDAAHRSALSYLTFNSSDADWSAIARELVKGSLNADALREHILEQTTFADERCAGKIWMFNAVTRQGNIIWAKGKLNFSYKDFVALDHETLDLQNNEYFVAFTVDDSHHVPKAANVELLCQTQRNHQKGS